MIENYVIFVTNLGNVVLVGTLAVVAAVYLAVAGSRNSALALISVFLATSLVISIVKLLCLSCHINPLDHDLRSPSGHMAMSTAVYCAITSIVTAVMKQRWQRIVSWACTAVLLLMIGISRVLLGLHSPDEVVAGLAVGGIVYGLVRYFMLRGETVAFNGRALALTAVAAVIVLHGVTYSGEPMIQWLAQHIRSHVTVC